MKRSNVCTVVLEIVSDVCEIPVIDIVGVSRKMDIVDARCIAVKVLVDFGMSRECIVHAIHRKNPYSVNQLLETYEARMRSPYFRWCSKEVKRLFDKVVEE
ncbi:MAG: hypothetical protein J6V13_03775 [Paludibacteraceae bacterium]|nr:hypothetical protein [Paludibacteraceae bacterium]